MKIYKRGTRKEYYLIDKLKKDFDIVQRTAGSHSPIDIIAINIKNKEIKLIQSKRTMNKTLNYIDIKLKNKIENENKCLNGSFFVNFECL